MKIPLQVVTETLGVEPAALGVPGDAPAAVFPEVSTDTRTLVEGSLFVALAGPRFDAHDHVAEAWRRGAGGIVAHRGVPPGPGPVWQVSDTLEALGRLARWVRRELDLRVVAITGSVGKTTTKELTAALLRRAGLDVLQTPGNWNNRVGLPLTLLGAGGHEEAAVLELGVSEPGEMSHLTAIAEPDVAVITAVDACHTEGMGDVDGVASEKLRIAGGLRPGGRLVLPYGDPHLAPPAGVPVTTFGWEPGADLALNGFRSHEGGGTSFRVGLTETTLAMAGRHNAANAAAALAAVQALGLPWPELATALGTVPPLPLRGEIRASKRGVHFLVDCYNANPTAVVAALETLADLSGEARRIAVLGEMRELGSLRAREHARVGAAAVRLGIEELHLLGPATADIREGATTAGISADQVWLYDDRDTLAASLTLKLRPGDWVLVKGSRALGLESVVERLGA